MPATLTRRKPKPEKIGQANNGSLMSPEEFDRLEPEFEEGWRYELINGVLIVSPLPSVGEVDPNEELGHLLRTYQESHPRGKSLNKTLPERLVKPGKNRRRADRLIWAGLGRLPRKSERPTIIVEFVSGRKRDRQRDYEEKRDEYQAMRVKEYWIIDRFERCMTAFRLDGVKFSKRVVGEDQVYRTPLLPGFELPLGKLLALADAWHADEPENDSNDEDFEWE